jgi:hypothetical protein
MRGFISLAAMALAVGVASAAEQEWIEVAADKRGFVLSESKRPFVVWGVNYDHDETGRLLEDYWATEWTKVEEDFREMQELGANVVRVHLQTGKFMQAPGKPNDAALEQLARLLRLAESLRMYLDVTGLGCYHRKDVPAWYDALNEKERWEVQAQFWEAVAKRCAASPAVFCHDLMNEPVVPGGAGKGEWLAGEFGGKCFVQYISRERAGRERAAVAREWIGQLVAAIRKHDQRHLITVGLVPWSLERPGITSGFVPEKVAGALDFVAVHIYPEKGKLSEALDTLRGFAVNKPVVIEEIFPLKCSTEELDEFIEKSRPIASGWVGFYWGRTPEEYRGSKTIPDAITLGWLELFRKKAAGR